jgi:hypothetical protein
VIISASLAGTRSLNLTLILESKRSEWKNRFGLTLFSLLDGDSRIFPEAKPRDGYSAKHSIFLPIFDFSDFRIMVSLFLVLRSV